MSHPPNLLELELSRRLAARLVIDEQQHKVYYLGQELQLQERSRELLIALAEKPNEVRRRDTLERIVWGSTIVEPGQLDTQIAQLRRELSRALVRTIPTIGFALAESPDQVITLEGERTA